MVGGRRSRYVPGTAEPFPLPTVLSESLRRTLFQALWFFGSIWLVIFAFENDGRFGMSPMTRSDVLFWLLVGLPAMLYALYRLLFALFTMRPASVHLGEEQLTLRYLSGGSVRLRWEWIERFQVAELPAPARASRVVLCLTAEGLDEVELSSADLLANRAMGRGIGDVPLPSLSSFGQRSHAELAARLNATLAERRTDRVRRSMGKS